MKKTIFGFIAFVFVVLAITHDGEAGMVHKAESAIQAHHAVLADL